jgi:CheY-like chemotaxis protein
MDAKPKILLVGDSKTERDGLELALGRRGFEVKVSSTFELKFAVALEQPDLVLVDVGELGADQVARLVTDEEADFKVALFSDRPAPELRELAAKCHAAAISSSLPIRRSWSASFCGSSSGHSWSLPVSRESESIS